MANKIPGVDPPPSWPSWKANYRRRVQATARQYKVKRSPADITALPCIQHLCVLPGIVFQSTHRSWVIFFYLHKKRLTLYLSFYLMLVYIIIKSSVLIKLLYSEIWKLEEKKKTKNMSLVIPEINLPHLLLFILLLTLLLTPPPPPKKIRVDWGFFQHDTFSKILNFKVPHIIFVFNFFNRGNRFDHDHDVDC